MAGRRERYRGHTFTLRNDLLSVRTERRQVDDGREGVVCTLFFTFENEDRFVTFLMTSNPGQPLFLDRVEGGGSVPGRVVGLLRDHAKQQIKDFLSKS